MVPSAPLKLWFSPAPWSDQVAGELAEIAAFDARDLDALRAGIEGGGFALWDVLADGERIGCVIWSVSQEHDHAALVVNALVARPVAGASVAGLVLDKFRHFARATGASAVRCWTQRPGLVRTLGEGAKITHVMEWKA